MLHFTSIHGACLKTLQNLGGTVGIIPVEDSRGVSDRAFRACFQAQDDRDRLARQGKPDEAAVFRHGHLGPGVRVPWEDLAATCHDLGIYSVLDAAHGIGHLDLTHLAHRG